jgi:hypothetical protein
LINDWRLTIFERLHLVFLGLLVVFLLVDVDAELLLKGCLAVVLELGQHGVLLQLFSSLFLFGGTEHHLIASSVGSGIFPALSEGVSMHALHTLGSELLVHLLLVNLDQALSPRELLINALERSLKVIDFADLLID